VIPATAIQRVDTIVIVAPQRAESDAAMTLSSVFAVWNRLRASPSPRFTGPGDSVGFDANLMRYSIPPALN
ncbi:MAG: hypothetical protein ACRDND_21635, partial [Streptosporangiaceae bacterium]